MTLPIERYKEAYKNWRYNPFTPADLATDKEEDGLLIPGGAPFVVQLLEVPRKNDPTSVSVRCYDTKTDVDQNSNAGQRVLNVTSTVGFNGTDLIVINRGGAREEECVVDTVQAGVSLTMVDNLTETHTAAQADDVEKYIEFAEVAGAPAQSQFRVDYPPADGEGTGLIDFNANDTGKEIRVNYKATGSPVIEEFLDTKVSYPAGDPTDHQVIGFVSGAPDWRNNPIRYFHEGSVIYHASGENESCLLFRFKRTANEGTVKLELKGAKLHQGYYTELAIHGHDLGTLAVAASVAHTHGKGTLVSDAVGTHTHAKGTIATSSGGVAHTHGVGTLAVGNESAHTHAKGTLAVGNESAHTHAKGTLAVGNESAHTHGVGTLAADAVGTHTHAKGTLVNASASDHTHAKGTLAGSQATHTHGVGTLAGSQSTHTHSVSGNTGNQIGSHKHQYLAGDSSTFTQNEDSTHYHAISFTSGSGGNEAVSISGSTAAAGNQAVAISGSTAADGGHNHVISGSTAAGGGHGHSLSGTSAAGSAHAHSLSGATASGSAHTHSLAGSTAAGAAHNHSLSGATASDSIAHTHPVTGSTAADGGHGHTISGSTASDGIHAHSLSGTVAEAGVTPKTYPDELKVYINGVNKTADLLALTALTEFGDGTSGHDFVTTGSGEMDISALVAAAQIHEIAVTAPVVGNGGRVLLHIELF